MGFDGFCFSCGGYIEPGREVIIADEQGKPKVLCPQCSGGKGDHRAGVLDAVRGFMTGRRFTNGHSACENSAGGMFVWTGQGKLIVGRAE